METTVPIQEQHGSNETKRGVGAPHRPKIATRCPCATLHPADQPGEHERAEAGAARAATKTAENARGIVAGGAEQRQQLGDGCQKQGQVAEDLGGEAGGELGSAGLHGQGQEVEVGGHLATAK